MVVYIGDVRFDGMRSLARAMTRLHNPVDPYGYREGRSLKDLFLCPVDWVLPTTLTGAVRPQWGGWRNQPLP